MQNAIFKKKVFFGCSMRGGQAAVSREDLARFPVMIEELGCELASKHQTEKGVIQKENLLSKTEIHDRDYQWILASACGVFEISNPSLGVGGEISDMLHEGKPVLCLYKKELEASVSAYILGKDGSLIPFKGRCECRSYETLEEAKSIIGVFLGQ